MAVGVSYIKLSATCTCVFQHKEPTDTKGRLTILLGFFAVGMVSTWEQWSYYMSVRATLPINSILLMSV